MLFTREFISSIKIQPASRLMKACAMAFDRLDSKTGWDEESYDILSETYAVVSSVIEAGLLTIEDLEPPVLKARLSDNCVSLNQYLLHVRKECQVLVQLERIELLKARTKHSLWTEAPPVETYYQFEPQEIGRLRELLTQMKQVLARCSDLDPRVLSRMERRLTALEGDLRASMPDWDRFWGTLGEARAILGRCGEEARHIVLGFTEMSQIVGAAQSRGSGLAPTLRSSMPLGKPDDVLAVV